MVINFKFTVYLKSKNGNIPFSKYVSNIFLQIIITQSKQKMYFVISKMVDLRTYV